jgi:hypothetical protein
MIRIMVETNDYNVLGLIASDLNSRGGPPVSSIHDIINAYETAYPNLIKHASG